MPIDNFIEFILESSGSDFPFHLSDAMVDILKKIDDPISTQILHLNSTKEFVKHATLIDTDFDEDMVSFVSPNLLRNSVYSSFEDEDELRRRFTLKPLTPSAVAWDTGRNKIRIGRLVRSLFGDKFNNSEVEIFVNKFKAVNNRTDSHFEVWNLVKKAYESSRYSTKYGQSNPLHVSCMNDMGDILDFYTHNDRVVEVLVLLEDESDTTSKIIGRALLWRTEYGTFMDRVYCIHEKDYYRFIDMAKEKEAFYKSANRSSPGITYIKDDKESWFPIEIDIKYPIDRYEELPYMDTFCYAYGTKISNSEPTFRTTDYYYKLTGINGEFETYSEEEE